MELLKFLALVFTGKFLLKEQIKSNEEIILVQEQETILNEIQESKNRISTMLEADLKNTKPEQTDIDAEKFLKQISIYPVDEQVRLWKQYLQKEVEKEL